MKLTTKGRYAVTAILDLALHREQGPVNLAEISNRQAISLSYLEQLFSRLRKFGLVSSARGPGGGYLLGREATEITIADVIGAVDESVLVILADETFHLLRIAGHGAVPPLLARLAPADGEALTATAGFTDVRIVEAEP